MNINMESVFVVFVAAKMTQQLLFNLYLLQLKEYRLDRFKEHASRVYGFFPLALLRLTILSLPSPKKFPRLTLKSASLFFVNLILYGAAVFLLPLSLFTAALFVTPFVLFFSLWVFFPFEFIVRKLFYLLASKKISSLQKEHALIVVGITGSYGKSTTKHFLSSLLKVEFRILSTPKSINTPLAISIIVLKKLKKDHQIFIVEMGAYKKGEIKQLCNIVHPRYAIITGIGNQHIALFGSQDNIISSKSELINSLPKDGVVFINKDSIQPVFNKANYKKIVYFGNKTKMQEPSLELAPSIIPNLLLNNLRGAVLAAKQLGASPSAIKKALRSVTLPPNTMHEKIGYKRAVIINDSYSANIEGTIAALNYLGSLPQKKKVFIFKPLIELGNVATIAHEQIGEKAGEIASYIAITDKQQYLSIKKGVGNKCRLELITNTQVLIKALQDRLDKNTAVLIEGRINRQIINFLTMKGL